MLLDPSPDVGDSARAFFRLLSTYTYPLGLFLVADDENHKEWLRQQIVEFCGSLWLAGHLQHTEVPMAETPPEDRLVGVVPRPALSVMVYGPPAAGDDETLKAGSDLLGKWKEHVEFKEQFAMTLDGYKEEFGDIMINNKRSEPSSSLLSPKKAKTETPDAKTCAIEELPGELVAECALAHPKNNRSYLQFRSEGQVALVNKSGDPVEYSESWCFSGFPTKGAKWTKEVRDENLALHFDIKGPEDLVIIGSSVKSLYQVMDEKRLEDPDKATLCFYKMEPRPTATQPGGFTISMTKAVHWTLPEQQQLLKVDCTDATMKLTAGVAGGAIPLKNWLRSELVVVTWLCKWQNRGLAPVMPRLRLKHGLVLPAGHGIMLLD